MADSDHPRLILHNFLSPHLCKELEFIHKSSSTVGYRPNVFSTTLSHLIATNSAHLIMPFIPIRERLKEKVEEFFGCPYELFVEFTGLISWSRGASIGWHSDDNRPYLKQRDFAAVCYLNTYGMDFRGGLFHFQDGEPATFKPMTGDVLLYTADSRNIHSVDEVAVGQFTTNYTMQLQLGFNMRLPNYLKNPTEVKILDGERLTLTLWFTRDKSHDEDSKLISFINRSPSNISNEFDTYPLPASDDMYWFSLDQASNHHSGFDSRCARIHILGYDLYSSKLRSFSSAVDFSEVLIEPLQLSRANELFEKQFANVMHLLQVVHFYHWKVAELQTFDIKRKTNNIMSLSQSELDEIDRLKLALIKDLELAETVFGSPGSKIDPFDWDIFSAAVVLWESYTRKLIQEMHMHLPYWSSHQSLFINPLLDLEEGT